MNQTERTNPCFSSALRRLVGSMIARIPFVAAAVILFSVILANPAFSQSKKMVYLYNGPESPTDHRYDYHWQVLHAALEKTVKKYGPYRMEPTGFMNEERQVSELQNGTGNISVMIRGGLLEYENIFEAVWIPIDKGLLGYRVFLIRQEDQPLFTQATTLDDLRHYSIGQGSGWRDIDILRANGLTVTPGGEYEGLFAMLANHRFDLFSRGVEEVSDEYGQQKKQFPNLAIEKNLMLYYPVARFFWFAKTKEGHRLAQRAREGMMQMVKDGSMDRMFMAAHKDLIERLHLENRKMFVLKDPLAAAGVPVNDRRLWYSPLKKKKGPHRRYPSSSRTP